ncbi:MAG: retropepsin-like aspartic protease [Cyanobacteria bacterium P01_F01_bin.13]
MLEKKRIRFVQLLCLGTLAACQSGPVQTEALESLASVPAQITTSVDSESSTSESSTKGVESVDVKTDAITADNTVLPSAYQEAINLASSAFTLGQQATSPDDWGLIVGRWEQAIQKLKDVPANGQNYPVAQTKLRNYERNLAQAKQRLQALSQPPAEIALNRPSRATPFTGEASLAAAPTSNARIPIIERRSGTPVIEVMVNDKRYPMILDTGASHTHITRAMANELGVQVIGQTSVATASSRQVAVDVGYVDSIKVGNVARANMPVSIGDAVPIGLLGNDVYKNFDVILQANSVEFRPR